MSTVESIGEGGGDKAATRDNVMGMKIGGMCGGFQKGGFQIAG